MYKKEKPTPSNYRIRAKKVLCIESNGNNLGIISKDEAIQIAKSKELDLVMISDGKDGIPICRILDYGKFKYEQSKKKKEAFKKQRESLIKTKEVKLRPSTDINDLKTKSLKVQKFLDEGDRVKISIVFRGREITHKNIGHDTLNDFFKMISNFEKITQPSIQGKILSVLIGKGKGKD